MTGSNTVEHSIVLLLRGDGEEELAHRERRRGEVLDLQFGALLGLELSEQLGKILCLKEAVDDGSVLKIEKLLVKRLLTRYKADCHLLPVLARILKVDFHTILFEKLCLKLEGRAGFVEIRGVKEDQLFSRLYNFQAGQSLRSVASRNLEVKECLALPGDELQNRTLILFIIAFGSKRRRRLCGQINKPSRIL